MKWRFPLYGTYQKEMRRNAAEYFKANNCAVSSKYEFILRDRDDWGRNIILPEVVNLVLKLKDEAAKDKKSFPLHRYIHHGLSSQAMVFNIVGPLIERDDLSAMKEAFVAAGIRWPNASLVGQFEYEDRKVFGETQAQPTSLDVAIGRVKCEPEILIESKLVEQEFGGCSVFERGVPGTPYVIQR